MLDSDHSPVSLLYFEERILFVFLPILIFDLEFEYIDLIMLYVCEKNEQALVS